uniref:DUF7778 domain-containing protein n=1 Tax=Caenorhabditis japonica TaxID=281687 RepID=A0A8R1I9W6_CAEJA
MPPSTTVSNERHESLRIAKRLNKFIPLPNIQNWKVHSSDSLHRGRVLCLLRSKRFFLPDDVSSLKMRMATVTKHGFLVLYETADQGLIIDLRAATHILTSCDKYKAKRIKYSRSHIKIRLQRGNVHIFVRDEDVANWTGAILKAHVSTKPLVVRSDTKKENVEIQTTSTETELSTVPDNEIVKVPTSSSSSSSPSEMTSSNSGLITVIERSTPSEESQLPSVRRGTIPVNTLLQKLEKEMPAKKNEDVAKNNTNIFVSSMFVFHSGHPIPGEGMEEDIKKEESKEPKKKEWWMSSLRC